MINSSQLSQNAWFTKIDPLQQRLIQQSFELLEREKKLESHLFDYSFIMFPMAKAYEGFLKTFLYELGFINQEVYLGRKFRIGRALNPDISEKYQDEWWLYDDVSNRCSEELARHIWDAWISCRNHVFHYFPSDQNQYDLSGVEEKMNQLVEVFEHAYECRVSMIK